MRDADLVDGDLVAVQTNCRAEVGDIVVAVVDGQVTVKHLRQEPVGRFFLSAGCQPGVCGHLPGRGARILGIVVGQCPSCGSELPPVMWGYEPGTNNGSSRARPVLVGTSEHQYCC